MNFCNRSLQQRLHKLHENGSIFNLQQNDFISCCNGYTNYTRIKKARILSSRNWKLIWYRLLKQQLHELHEKVWAWLKFLKTDLYEFLWSMFAATVTRTTQKNHRLGLNFLKIDLYEFCNQSLQQRLHKLHENCLTLNLQQNDFISCCNGYTNYTRITKARNLSWRNW